MLYPAYRQNFILNLSGIKSNFELDTYYNNKESIKAILACLNDRRPYAFLTDISFNEIDIK
jgi:hypothetical protein